jgi:hypothetical protein
MIYRCVELVCLEWNNHEVCSLLQIYPINCKALYNIFPDLTFRSDKRKHGVIHFYHCFYRQQDYFLLFRRIYMVGCWGLLFSEQRSYPRGKNIPWLSNFMSNPRWSQLTFQWVMRELQASQSMKWADSFWKPKCICVLLPPWISLDSHSSSGSFIIVTSSLFLYCSSL